MFGSSQGYAVTNLGLRRYGNSYAEVFDTIAPFNFYNFNLQEIECPEGLAFEEFGALYDGIALQNLDQFCHVSSEQDDRCFISQAWNMLFRIKKQLGREKRSITMRQFIQALGRHSGKEKVTLDDLFLLHSMDGGVSVDIPWHVAKFLSDKAKGSKRKSPIVGAHLIRKIASYYGLMTLGALMNVTLGPETSSMSVAKLVDLGICRYNDLGIGEMVAKILEVAGDDDVGAGQAEIGGVGHHPNRSNANRLRAMEERLGEIVNDIDELTYVVSGMSEQYDKFYEEFGHWVQQGVNFMSDTLAYSTAPSPFASHFGEWLKFNNRDFTLDTQKEFKKRLTEIRIKEIECPKGLDFEEFGALHEGISLQNLDQFCHVSFEQDDRRFISQAWNRLFRIKEQVVREYVMEFLSSFTFRDHIEKLDVADTMVFQLGRHSGKEKVTLDDLFLLHSMDGGVSVDVPWHVAKFLSDKAKGSKRKSPIVGAHLIGKIASYYALMTLRALMNVTLGLETSSMSVAKLVDLGIS
ncbi:hypothetical protein Tco_0749610 [Tanacetum coccineum]|uniref:Uncharacterized protein n=1 Tax=Tanacetum coccineum TaxID=301880 RepID=A0ABQ4YYZ2_9ASTR